MSMEVSGILVAAHELKAPLCLIRQLTLALGVASSDSAKQRLESQLVEVSERALRQVEDLSKIARLEDGLFITEPVSVRGICEAVMREISPLFQFEHRNLTTNLASQPLIANYYIVLFTIFASMPYATPIVKVLVSFLFPIIAGAFVSVYVIMAQRCPSKSGTTFNLVSYLNPLALRCVQAVLGLVSISPHNSPSTCMLN